VNPFPPIVNTLTWTLSSEIGVLLWEWRYFSGRSMSLMYGIFLDRRSDAQDYFAVFFGTFLPRVPFLFSYHLTQGRGLSSPILPSLAGTLSSRRSSHGPALSQLTFDPLLPQSRSGFKEGVSLCAQRLPPIVLSLLGFLVSSKAFRPRGELICGAFWSLSIPKVPPRPPLCSRNEKFSSMALPLFW